MYYVRGMYLYIGTYVHVRGTSYTPTSMYKHGATWYKYVRVDSKSSAVYEVPMYYYVVPRTSYLVPSTTYVHIIRYEDASTQYKYMYLVPRTR